QAASLYFLIGPLERPSHLPLSGLPQTRVEATWQRMSSRIIAVRKGSIGRAGHTIPICSKKRRTQAFSVPKRRPKRACIDTPKLPRATVFTIMTNAMRRPLVARGVGDLGPAKAESSTLFCFPNLFRYFLAYYVTY